MSGTIVNLLIQIVGGAIGGNGAGAALKNFNLGPIGNTIAGAIGGGVGGQLLTMVLPMLQNGHMDAGAIAGQLIGGGVAGGVLTAIIGAVKNGMSGAPAK